MNGFDDVATTWSNFNRLLVVSVPRLPKNGRFLHSTPRDQSEKFNGRVSLSFIILVLSN